jgi:hypothetical protein
VAKLAGISVPSRGGWSGGLGLGCGFISVIFVYRLEFWSVSVACSVDFFGVGASALGAFVDSVNLRCGVSGMLFANSINDFVAAGPRKDEFSAGGGIWLPYRPLTIDPWLG